MVEVTLYGNSVKANDGNWTNPTEALGSPDGVCAYKRTNTPGQYNLDIAFDFSSIPANAVISNVKFGFHNVYGGNPSDYGFAYLMKGIGSEFWSQIDAYYIGGSFPGCAACQDRESGNLTTINRAALETCFVRVQVWQMTTNLMQMQCDCVWITVTYSVPAARAIGEGLTWVG